MQRISRIITLGTGVLGLVCGSVRAAEVGTAFTYQGELVRDGTLESWGNNDSQLVTNTPAGTFTAAAESVRLKLEDRSRPFVYPEVGPWCNRT